MLAVYLNHQRFFTELVLGISMFFKAPRMIQCPCWVEGHSLMAGEGSMGTVALLYTFSLDLAITLTTSFQRDLASPTFRTNLAYFGALNLCALPADLNRICQISSGFLPCGYVGVGLYVVHLHFTSCSSRPSSSLS